MPRPVPAPPAQLARLARLAVPMPTTPTAATLSRTVRPHLPRAHTPTIPTAAPLPLPPSPRTARPRLPRAHTASRDPASRNSASRAHTASRDSASRAHLPRACRCFSTAAPRSKEKEPIAAYAPRAALEPAALSDTQYHALADAFLDRLVARLEDMQDARDDVDVEYASGVLTLAFDAQAGEARGRTYVVNKQPPNKQIWLSSPVSGPKRYDWVVDGAGPGTGGRWVYLKDDSCFNDLLRDEIGVDLDEPDSQD